MHQRLEAGRPGNEATQMYCCMKADETAFVEERMAQSGASVPESVCLREQTTLLASLYTSTIPRETDSVYKTGRQ